MPLWLVGTGISGARSIPAEGADAISHADVIYYEQFTSPSPAQDMLACISHMAPDRCITKDAKRWMVEDGGQILEDAQTKNTVLISYGDPLVATTHTELLYRASKSRIQAQVIHASSGPTSVIGECGLHHYKMGKMATIMRDSKSMTTPYYTIYKNAVEGCHTLLLLEYDYEGTESGSGKSFFLEPADALNGLLRTEEGQRRNVICDDTYAIIASRIGDSDSQHITAGTISSLIARRNFGAPPHSIIIPGMMHFTESDALGMLAACIEPPPGTDVHQQDASQESDTKKGNADNGTSSTCEKRQYCIPVRISEQMITKYAPMIRRSIDEVAQQCGEDDGTSSIIENARLYVSDAEEFIKKEGHEEVAVLSIGYADGLADALRLLRGLDVGNRAESAASNTDAGPKNDRIKKD